MACLSSWVVRAWDSLATIICCVFQSLGQHQVNGGFSSGPLTSQQFSPVKNVEGDSNGGFSKTTLRAYCTETAASGPQPHCIISNIMRSCLLGCGVSTEGETSNFQPAKGVGLIKWRNCNPINFLERILNYTGTNVRLAFECCLLVNFEVEFESRKTKCIFFSNSSGKVEKLCPFSPNCQPSIIPDI